MGGGLYPHAAASVLAPTSGVRRGNASVLPNHATSTQPSASAKGKYTAVVFCVWGGFRLCSLNRMVGRSRCVAGYPHDEKHKQSHSGFGPAALVNTSASEDGRAKASLEMLLSVRFGVCAIRSLMKRALCVLAGMRARQQGVSNER